MGRRPFSARIGHLTLGVKRAGKRSAGEPPAPFDVAGVGNVTTGAGLRPTPKGVDKPPDPTVRAPALDPTLGEEVLVTAPPHPTVGEREGSRMIDNGPILVTGAAGQ